MYKSIVMHQLDYNYIAASEEWYYRCHGPQIARRYGPWLARFESYRPVPLPADLSAEMLGYTNWLTTIGIWREIPEEGPMGEMAMSTPKVNARNFSAFCPPQSADDFKGSDLAPEDKSCLRFLIMWKYPDGVDKQQADSHFLGSMVPQICASPSVYRFFSTKTLTEEIHLPGTWKPQQLEYLMANGKREDHQWDRIAELWFETFDDVRDFLEYTKQFSRPTWSTTDRFPFIEPYKNYVSTILLERPAFDWMQNYNVYR